MLPAEIGVVLGFWEASTDSGIRVNRDPLLRRELGLEK